jgi:hypothetical protein
MISCVYLYGVAKMRKNEAWSMSQSKSLLFTPPFFRELRIDPLTY